MKLIPWLFLLLLTACQQTGKVVTQEREWRSDQEFFDQQYDAYAKMSDRKLTAKVAVKTANINESANLIWQTIEATDQHINLYGPFGSGAVKVDFNEQSALLTDANGKQHQRDNAEQLLSQIIGWPIPVNALSYWVFGLPEPGSKFQYSVNEQGQVAAIRQLGWEIKYTQFKQFEEIMMPRKISALTDKPDEIADETVRVKLVAKNWQWQ